MTSWKYVNEGNRRPENIVFTIAAGTRDDIEWGSFTVEIGVGMDVVRVLDTPAVTTFCRASSDHKQGYSRLKMSQIIPERDFPCASKTVALDGCAVRCFFVCVLFVSSAPAPVLRFLDPFSLFDMAPTEPKYESIGSSPDMDERGLMEVQRCFERAIGAERPPTTQRHDYLPKMGGKRASAGPGLGSPPGEERTEFDAQCHVVAGRTCGREFVLT